MLDRSSIVAYFRGMNRLPPKMRAQNPSLALRGLVDPRHYADYWCEQKYRLEASQ